MQLLHGVSDPSGAVLLGERRWIDSSWSCTLPAGFSARYSGVLFVSPIVATTTSSSTPTYSAAIRALTEFWWRECHRRVRDRQAVSSLDIHMPMGCMLVHLSIDGAVMHFTISQHLLQTHLIGVWGVVQDLHDCT